MESRQQTFAKKLEQEQMKKSTKLTQDEIDTLTVEFHYCQKEAETEARKLSRKVA